YRPGGYSSYNPITSQPAAFDAESNTAFELGSKNRLLDNRLQLNAALFLYKQSGYQNLDKYNMFYITVPGIADPVLWDNTTTSVYAGCVPPSFNLKAHVLGFETQVRYAITNSDILGFNGTWLDAKFDDKQGTCATVGITPDLPGYTTDGVCYDGYNDQA